MASGNAEGSSNIPQWKRDLIQRRRQQQNKIIIFNGVKMSTENDCSVPLSTNDNQLLNIISSDNNQYNETINTTTLRGKLLDDRGDSGNEVELGIVGRENTGGVSVAGGAIASTNRESLYSGSTVAATSTATITTTLTNSVASNMRLEAEVFVCPTSEEPPKFVGKNNSNYLINNAEHSTTTTKTTPAIHEQFVKDSSRNFNNTKKITLKNNSGDNKDMASILTMDNKNNDKYLFSEFRKRNFNKIMSDGNNKLLGNGKAIDDCESDSSEELQYGPGIVNKLKSKYLNLTLREMNKTRVSVQRFRRAASLEDLLDCNADDNDDINSVDGDGNEDDDDDDDGGLVYVISQFYHSPIHSHPHLVTYSVVYINSEYSSRQDKRNITQIFTHHHSPTFSNLVLSLFSLALTLFGPRQRAPCTLVLSSSGRHLIYTKRNDAVSS